jgi:DNA-binding NarL/FixJ family response regulator
MQKVKAYQQNRRILIVDDHPLFRFGLSTLINSQPDLLACCEASSSASALTEMRICRPDGAIVDISLPGINGIELIKIMRAELAKLRILVVSMHEAENYALRALRAGALGYVNKQDAIVDVVDALRQILSGGVYLSPEFSERLVLQMVHNRSDDADSPLARLSPRELAVLELLGRKLRAREIGSELSISPRTVDTYCRCIRRKFDFRSIAQLRHFAVGWFTQKRT